MSARGTHQHYWMTQTHGIDSTLAGYRVVRRIASGSRADVFLGAGSTGTVVLKVFQTHVDRADVGAEFDALGRFSSPHVVSLVDVSSGANALPIAVLERVPRGSVAQLLRDRESLQTGEAVTLLAPLAATLPQLHAAGVAHTRLSAAAVHLGASGQPVILGLGHASRFAPGGSVAALDAEPGAASDRDAMAMLAVAVLERVRGAAAPDIRRLVEWIQNEPHRFEFASELEQRLFDLAEPQPIEFARSARDGVPARVVEVVPETAQASVGRRNEPLAVRGSTRLPSWIDGLMVDGPIDAIRQRAVAFAKGVRRPYWFIAGGVALALILALSLIPNGSTTAAPAAATSTPSSTPIPTERALPTDPMQALPLLLEARNVCVRDLSVLCLDEVDQDSSGAYLADVAAIRQLEAGGKTEESAIVTASAPKLVETLGETALIDLGAPDGSTAQSSSTAQSNPASVLMIKTKAGWRIRDFLSGKQATP
jgi:eukaryotic-like serine/threonine-protein kinase